MLAKRIIEFPKYAVTQDGRIWSHYGGSWKPLRPAVTDGHLYVSLRGSGGKRTVKVSRIVARYWIGPCPNGFHVHHRDLNKANNHYGNLQYREPSGHCREHALVNRINAKITKEQAIQVRAKFFSKEQTVFELSGKYGLTPSSIANIVAGVTWGEV